MSRPGANCFTSGNTCGVPLCNLCSSESALCSGLDLVVLSEQALICVAGDHLRFLQNWCRLSQWRPFVPRAMQPLLKREYLEGRGQGLAWELVLFRNEALSRLSIVFRIGGLPIYGIVKNKIVSASNECSRRSLLWYRQYNLHFDDGTKVVDGRLTYTGILLSNYHPADTKRPSGRKGMWEA